VKGRCPVLPNHDHLMMFRASAVSCGSDDLLWVADLALEGDPNAFEIVAAAMNKAADALADASEAAAALRASRADPE
jgi:hypothetical protein